MEFLVWIGAVISLVGLAGLIWCILRVAKAKRRTSDDTALRDEVRAVLPWNLGSLLLSAFGLMLVTLGVLLG